MVGPCGLEPQTSTVSICWSDDYRLLLKATKCKCVNKMRSLWRFHHNRSYVVNFVDRTRSVLNSVFNFTCTRFGGREPNRTVPPLAKQATPLQQLYHLFLTTNVSNK